MRRLMAVVRRPLLLDVGVVAGLAAGSVVIGWSLFVQPVFLKSPKVAQLSLQGWWQAPRWWWAASAVALLALLVRRRYPVVSFAAAAGATLFHVHSAWPFLPADAAVLVALYSVAAYGKRLVAVAVLITALALAVVQSAAPLKFFGWSGGLGFLCGLLVASWFAGAYVGQMRQRAVLLERERDEQAELATRAERERITRELHDVVAHGLSVIVVQAQGAAASLTARPDETRQALEAIVTTGRQSLAEMRRLLGISRPAGEARAPVTPQPGLAMLPELIEQIRGTGLPVDLSVGGPPRQLPGGVDLSAYRVVQEGLTNALRHAGHGATASVRLRYLPDLVEIDLENTQAAADGSLDGQGRGLRGMRERAGLLGGTFEAGYRDGGRFVVTVQLPTQVGPA